MFNTVKQGDHGGTSGSWRASYMFSISPSISSLPFLNRSLVCSVFTWLLQTQCVTSTVGLLGEAVKFGVLTLQCNMCVSVLNDTNTRWPSSHTSSGRINKHCSVVLHLRLVLFYHTLFCFSLFIQIISRHTLFCMCPTDTLTPRWRGCGV